jgi:hypothetical protein
MVHRRLERRVLAERDQQHPPAHVKGTRRAPEVPATWPHARHGLLTFTASSWIRERNSLLEPWVDVWADLEAINAGEGIYDPSTRRIWIHGRLYGMHEHGTTFPIEGEGIISVDRPTYKALMILRRYNGVNDRSEREITSDLSINEADRAEAVRIWRLREKAHGHAADHDV